MFSASLVSALPRRRLAWALSLAMLLCTRPAAQPHPSGESNGEPAAPKPPVYRTRMPPPATLAYDLSHGVFSGSGELQWRPAGDRYEARLEGRVAAFHVLTWASEGGVDAAGLAPVRFTDKRRGRPLQAADFQRSTGRITYSMPSVEQQPLLPGTQDRLSWMIQLAAIAVAEPAQLAPGRRIVFFVSGARGDADDWAFQVLGPENVVTGSGTLRAIRLLREPRKPKGTRAEVWLDPSRHYLPIRARLTSGRNGDTLELLLKELHLPP